MIDELSISCYTKKEKVPTEFTFSGKTFFPKSPCEDIANYMVFKRAILNFDMVSTHVHVRHSQTKKDKRIRKVNDSFGKPSTPQNQVVKNGGEGPFRNNNLLVSTKLKM